MGPVQQSGGGLSIGTDIHLRAAGRASIVAARREATLQDIPYMLLSGYEVRAYVNSRNGKAPVAEFLKELRVNVRDKIIAYATLLAERGGHMEYPYTSHVAGPLRELRVDFARDRHRIFFFATDGRKIILLHGFIKRSQKLPRREIETARKNLEEYLRYRIDAPLS